MSQRVFCSYDMIIQCICTWQQNQMCAQLAHRVWLRVTDQHPKFDLGTIWCISVHAVLTPTMVWFEAYPHLKFYATTATTLQHIGYLTNDRRGIILHHPTPKIQWCIRYHRAPVPVVPDSTLWSEPPFPLDDLRRGHAYLWAPSTHLLGVVPETKHWIPVISIGIYPIFIYKVIWLNIFKFIIFHVGNLSNLLKQKALNFPHGDVV